jgi:hypothetical protein
MSHSLGSSTYDHNKKIAKIKLNYLETDVSHPELSIQFEGAGSSLILDEDEIHHWRSMFDEALKVIDRRRKRK